MATQWNGTLPTLPTTSGGKAAASALAVFERDPDREPQDHQLSGPACCQNEWVRQPVRVFLVAADHHFGPGWLMIGCQAEGKLWTRGTVPQNCVLDGCTLFGLLEVSPM